MALVFPAAWACEPSTLVQQDRGQPHGEFRERMDDSQGHQHDDEERRAANGDLAERPVLGYAVDHVEVQTDRRREQADLHDDNKGHSTAAKKYLKENPHKIKYIRSSLTRSVQNRKEPTPEEIAQLKPLNSQDDEIPFVTFEVTYIPLGDSIMPLQQHIGSYVRNSSDLALQEVQYRITEDGKYEFKDHREVVEFKRNKKTVTDGFRPITERTFYLQTKRKGMLLEELTYGEFKDMTVSEQRVAFSGSEVEEPIYIASAINDENAEFFEKLPTDAEKHKVEFELEEVMTFKYRDESLVDFAEKKYKEKKEKAGKGQEVETKEEIVLERNNERWMVGFNMMDLITHRVKYENMNEARNPVAVNTNPNYN